MLLTPFFIL